MLITIKLPHKKIKFGSFRELEYKKLDKPDRSARYVLPTHWRGMRFT